jgi:hypothetical protein
MVIDHDEDNLSDKETFSKNIPAIGKKGTLRISIPVWSPIHAMRQVDFF